MWESQNLKFGPKINVLRQITLGPVGVASPNLSAWCREAGMKNGYTFLGACTLKISGRTNWRDFGQLLTLFANISRRN